MYLTKEEIYLMLFKLKDEQVIKVYDYIVSLQKEQEITPSLKVSTDNQTLND